MKEHQDEAIDRVLRGLNARSAPEQLAERTFQALHGRAAAAESARRTPVWSRPWIPAAAAAVLAAGALLVAHDHSAATRAVASPSLTRPLRMADSRPLQLARASAAPPKHLPVLHHVRSPRTPAAEGTVREVSYPAPPQPLTAQEKMLLEVAKNPTPDEIAMLDPVEQAKQAALDDARFEKFVAQSDEVSHP